MRLDVPLPFRLDLTVALLRRWPAGGTDPEWIDGAFVTAWRQTDGAVHVLRLAQPEPGLLDVELCGPNAGAGEAIAQLRTSLGLGCDLSGFHAAAATIPWLRERDRRWRGVFPARQSNIWEAGVNAIVYQSVSIASAGAAMERFIARFGTHLVHRDAMVSVFPSVNIVAAAADADLRALGLSAAKVAALRALAAAVIADMWKAAEFDVLPTGTLCERLMSVHGIGPWSAAVVALRGYGRLDVFPLRDSGVERTIAELSGGIPDAAGKALAALGSARGMLYHYLLLARLEKRRKIDPGVAHAPCAPES